jgi:hypothetical protein
LKIALDAITAERIHQNLLRATHEAGSESVASHEYVESPSR